MCYTKQVSTRKERLMKKAELKTLWELFVILRSVDD
jgi:hypothetical protein